MKLVSIIASLPKYTQVGVLYTLLGSINAAAINAAARKVGTDLKRMQDAEKATESKQALSIDKYNEYLNELRTKQLQDDHVEEVGFEKLEAEEKQRNYLSDLLTFRKPLLSIFHATVATMPQRDDRPTPDFSFEESLARQMAQEFVAQQTNADSIDAELIKAGAVTEEELAAADKKRHDDDQDFKKEFRFLILDTLRDADPEFVTTGYITQRVVGATQDEDGKFHAETDDEFIDGGEVAVTTEDEGNIAFSNLPEDYQHRLLGRILPKLIAAKEQNIARRRFDSDASTNILILGLAITAIKKVLGNSEADEKLARMQKLMAA